MERACNIDARGKLVRFIGGLCSFFIGTILTILIVLEQIDINIFLLPVVLCLGLGILAIWEAKSGWCIVRGMGFKTPI
ncbi:MAG: hypothetical protein ACKVI6_04890 [Candidatus Poseidoniales archaeon]|jgi:hypothetical protein|tara:strand:- start:3866 stop:4099 length:234 start_codon:yes stop_codon:yes gene_type:complete